MMREFIFVLIAMMMLVSAVMSAPAYSSEEFDDNLFVLTPLKGSNAPQNSLVVQKLKKSGSEFIPLYKYKQETHKKRRVNNGYRLPAYIEEAEFPTLA